MRCLITRFAISEFASAEGGLSRLWGMSQLWSFMPQREELIQYAIIFCSLCLIVQLGVIWGTKWGDRHLFVKSFVLSLFLHVCFAMNWYSFSQVGRASTPNQEDGTEEKKTELVAIQIQTEPVDETTLTEENDVLNEKPSPFSSKRPVSHAGVPRSRVEKETRFDESEMPIATRHDAPVPLREMEIPNVRGEVETPENVVVQSVSPPPATLPIDPSIPHITEEPSPAESSKEEPKNSPQRGAARRRSSPRTGNQSDLTREPETPNRVRQPIAGQSKTGRTIDDNAVNPVIVKNDEARLLDSPDVEIPVVNITPSVEEIRKQPAKSTFVASGIVTNSMTGKPIAGATIRVDQISRPSLKTTTRSDGSYQITLSDLPDNFAITATIDEFIPVSKNLSRGERNGMVPRTDFQLQPIAPTVVVVEENPAVHHVGDDRFEGRVNSQFQRKSEGASVTLRFRISQNEQQLQQVRGVVRFLAKGIQCPPDIRINRTALTITKRLSAEDGSFGPFEIPFETDLLRRGTNAIEIRSTQCTADLDDFEFVNVQIRMEPKE